MGAFTIIFILKSSHLIGSLPIFLEHGALHNNTTQNIYKVKIIQLTFLFQCKNKIFKQPRRLEQQPRGSSIDVSETSC